MPSIAGTAGATISPLDALKTVFRYSRIMRTLPREVDWSFPEGTARSGARVTPVRSLYWEPYPSWSRTMLPMKEVHQESFVRIGVPVEQGQFVFRVGDDLLLVVAGIFLFLEQPAHALRNIAT